MLLVLNHTKLYGIVWEKIYTQLHFKPSCSCRIHSFEVTAPFEIEDVFSVYGIENMSDAQLDRMDDIIRQIFIDVTSEHERMYALDWNHSAFLYDPRKIEEQRSVWIENDSGTGYSAYFPSFFPDGDYYFFIDENFRFGYLGHPWRQEVWIFGELLVPKFEHIYHELGWNKLK